MISIHATRLLSLVKSSKEILWHATNDCKFEGVFQFCLSFFLSFYNLSLFSHLFLLLLISFVFSLFLFFFVFPLFLFFFAFVASLFLNLFTLLPLCFSVSLYFCPTSVFSLSSLSSVIINTCFMNSWHQNSFKCFPWTWKSIHM